MTELPALAALLCVAAVAAAALALRYRWLYLAERDQRRRLRVAWENTTDLMGVIGVAEDGRFLNVDRNAVNVAWFRRAFPQASEADWKAMDLETLLRTRAGYSDAEVEAALAPHREVVRTGKPVKIATHLRTTGEDVHREGVLSPIFDGRGRVAQLLFRGTDVTALRDAEKRFHDILAHTPGLVAIIGRDDGRFRYVNEAWTRISGYSAGEATGLSVFDLGVWSSDRSQRDALAPAAAQRQSAQFERPLKRRDGTVAQLLFSVVPMDYEGEPCHVAIGIDVTGIAAARAEAQAMTAHFERVFRILPEPLSISTLEDGRLIEVNDAWLQFYGLRAADVLGRTIDELGLWVDPAARREIVQRVKAGETVEGFAGRFRTASGIAYGFLSAERISWKGQAVVVVATRDVTALERTRRIALEESRHFTKTFSASPVPLAITIEEQGRIVEVNAAWERFFGFTREEAIGRTSRELGLWEHPEDRDRHAAAVARGERVESLPTRLRRRSGEVADMLLSVVPMEWYGAPGRLTAMQDVTELRRSAEEIRRLNDSLEAKVRNRTADLERAIHELESFSYSVSHDLRAPLRHIAGFTRMLVEEGNLPPGSEAARFAERASRAATRLGVLIDELLDYSRLGRKSLEPHDTDLGRVVASIVEEMADGLAGRRVQWDIGPLPRVRADPALIRLVLQNLIDNAVKYTGTRDEARIEIGARLEDGEATVWVRDNGVGFDMRYSGKLFGVFQRVHTDAEFEGTGIGLANAKRILDRHGGRIWFDAAPGHGATFTFSLPAAAEAAKAA